MPGVVRRHDSSRGAPALIGRAATEASPSGRLGGQSAASVRAERHADATDYPAIPWPALQFSDTGGLRLIRLRPTGQSTTRASQLTALA